MRWSARCSRRMSSRPCEPAEPSSTSSSATTNCASCERGRRRRLTCPPMPDKSQGLGRRWMPLSQKRGEKLLGLLGPEVSEWIQVSGTVIYPWLLVDWSSKPTLHFGHRNLRPLVGIASRPQNFLTLHKQSACQSHRVSQSKLHKHNR